MAADGTGGSGASAGSGGAALMASEFAAGNYRFIPAVFQYSAGAAALPGYEIERVRFDSLPKLADGFAKIADYIKASGRPLTSFCACELRSPAAFTDQGFLDFNQHYVKTLAEWGIYDGKTNPVARSNVCPEIDPPSEPSFYAFSFVRPSTNATPSFVIAGSGEALEDYLDKKVFADAEGSTLNPHEADANGFNAFLGRYKKGLAAEAAAVDTL